MDELRCVWQTLVLWSPLSLLNLETCISFMKQKMTTAPSVTVVALLIDVGIACCKRIFKDKATENSWEELVQQELSTTMPAEGTRDFDWWQQVHRVSLAKHVLSLSPPSSVFLCLHILDTSLRVSMVTDNNDTDTSALWLHQKWQLICLRQRLVNTLLSFFGQQTHSSPKNLHSQVDSLMAVSARACARELERDKVAACKILSDLPRHIVQHVFAELLVLEILKGKKTFTRYVRRSREKEEEKREEGGGRRGEGGGRKEVRNTKIKGEIERRDQWVTKNKSFLMFLYCLMFRRESQQLAEQLHQCGYSMQCLTICLHSITTTTPKTSPIFITRICTAAVTCATTLSVPHLVQRVIQSFCHVRANPESLLAVANQFVVLGEKNYASEMAKVIFNLKWEEGLQAAAQLYLQVAPAHEISDRIFCDILPLMLEFPSGLKSLLPHIEKMGDHQVSACVRFSVAAVEDPSVHILEECETTCELNGYWHKVKGLQIYLWFVLSFLCCCAFFGPFLAAFPSPHSPFHSPLLFVIIACPVVPFVFPFSFSFKGCPHTCNYTVICCSSHSFFLLSNRHTYPPPLV